MKERGSYLEHKVNLGGRFQMFEVVNQRVVIAEIGEFVVRTEGGKRVFQTIQRFKFVLVPFASRQNFVRFVRIAMDYDHLIAA